MLRDKDIAGVVAKVGARVDHWHVASTPGARGADAASVAALLRAAGAGTGAGQSIGEYGDAARAYAAAQAAATPDDRILAFGSFLTVADVMRAHRLHADPDH
jgi:dihydrofolate synthase/folylpolyglutamate synthase